MDWATDCAVRGASGVVVAAGSCVALTTVLVGGGVVTLGAVLVTAVLQLTRATAATPVAAMNLPPPGLWVDTLGRMQRRYRPK